MSNLPKNYCKRCFDFYDSTDFREYAYHNGTKNHLYRTCESPAVMVSGSSYNGTINVTAENPVYRCLHCHKLLEPFDFGRQYSCRNCGTVFSRGHVSAFGTSKTCAHIRGKTPLQNPSKGNTYFIICKNCGEDLEEFKP